MGSFYAFRIFFFSFIIEILYLRLLHKKIMLLSRFEFRFNNLLTVKYLKLKSF